MAHLYDYRVDFDRLDVAFVSKRCPDQKYADRDQYYEDPLQDFFDRTIHNNPIGKLASRLIYPGSWKRIQKIISQHVTGGRFRLATEHDARRSKIQTYDRNLIDLMWVDRRFEDEQGQILVICCEGNCGYYEVGNMFTALAAGFSALGWNPPGFGRSTGSPEPSQIRSAVDSVMQYAMKVLGFSETNILVLGYSIGGYPAAWLASQYPRIRGLILDATFDQLVPLLLLHTQNKMEDILTAILKQDHNMDVVKTLSAYQGPVTIIRRSEDEILGVRRENGYVNHTNILLKNFLSMRYPEIVNKKTYAVLDEWLDLYDWTQELLLNQYVLKCPQCPSMLRSYMQDRIGSDRHPFPLRVGRSWDQMTREHLTLHLAERHLRTCVGKHVTELPPHFVAIPWDPFR